MDKNTFKKLISYLETTNNEQPTHPMVTSGPNKNTRAIGEFGLMPRTVQDLARQNPDKTDLDTLIQKAAPGSIEEILASNPDKYKQYVEQMSNKVLDRSNDSAEEAANRWHAGQNSSPARLREFTENNPGREQKMQDFLKSSQPVIPTYTEDLTSKFPEKEVLYNKIRSKLGIK